MIQLSPILALARAEARLTRRLVRYWVFVVLATLFTALQSAQFFFIHKAFSWASASAAAASPRYFVGNFGAIFMLVFFVGLIFLGYDIRARDRRERIHEVVDALPCSNLELVLGRALGIFVAVWVPLVTITLLLALVAWRPLRTPIEPWSLLSFNLLMAIPGYVFAIGLIFLLTLLVRHRLLAALASVLALALLFIAGIWWVPFYFTAFTDITGGYSVNFPSDLLPGLAPGLGLLQRLGYFAGGCALLVLAAAVHPRRDDARRGVLAGAGAGLFALALVLTGATWRDQASALAQKDRWRAAHTARRDDPVPDLRSITGRVSIDPGRRLGEELELTLAAPPGRPLERALFTLNPGMHVERVGVPGGQALEQTHRDGLLDVRLPAPLAPGESTRLALTLSGVPDARFAYLDETKELMRLNPANAQIFILGFFSSIYDSRFVALMPGVRWLPAPGAEIGRGDPLVRPADFFDVDLTVEVPEGWLVAGPGRREPAGGKAFRFAPAAPLPDVALVAAAFDSRAVEVDGVQLELLFHRGQEQNVEFFADSQKEIRDWLAERLGEARQVGLDYPYGGLTLVEVPNTLRGYGGGWRMDTTMGQPAMILMRESGFPTADFAVRRKHFEDAADEEGGVARAKRRALETFFENDINGGNPFLAAARSFFGFQTTGSGPEGVPLDFVCERLTSELVTSRRGFFSVHFFDQDFGREFGIAAQAMNDPNRVSDSYTDVLIHGILSTHKVWETLKNVSLLDLEPRQDPERAINVLNLKGGAMAQSMLDDLGRERTGQLLAALRASRRGELYRREDVVAAGRTIGEELEPWLALWIDETELPGFTLGHVRYQRLADAADGSAQYQLLATVHNGENAPGMLRLEYRLEAGEGPAELQRAEPVRVAGRGTVELGLVTAQPLRMVRVAPYLALNRDPFNVPLPPLDPEKVEHAEPFRGARPVDWQPDATGAIVVDDLDPGFTVEEAASRPLFRFAGRGDAQREMDEGLPVPLQGVRDADRWSRMTHADAWGRYRRTMVVVRGGSGKRHATFRAELPHAGEWELEYHVTKIRGRRSGPGKWSLTIQDGSGSRDAALDATAAETGWSSLGRFELAAGDVQVRVSDAAPGGYVEADAIRWTPAPGARSGGAVAARAGERP